MVSGILPVVGVPLPLFSYGGTSAVTLLVSFGLIMAAQREQIRQRLRVVPDLVSSAAIQYDGMANNVLVRTGTD